MPKKTAPMSAGLYQMEAEFTPSGNGIWHEVEVADPGSVRDVGQAERLDGDKALAARWRPLPVTVERFKRGGDFFPLEGHWAASAAAVKALRPLLRDRVEILPLKIVADYEEDEDYDFDDLPARPKLRERYPSLFALHPLGRVELGPSAQVEYFLDDEEIITDVDRYAFRPADLEGRHFFRIRGATELYLVSEAFRQVVQRHGLRGMVLRPVRYVADDDGTAEDASAGAARPKRGAKSRRGRGR